MQANLAILRSLANLPGTAVDDALLEAIDLSEPTDRLVLADALIEFGRPRGLAGLVARFHRLDPAVQARLRERVRELSAGLRAAGASTSRQTRMNAVELIGDSRALVLAPLAVAALGDSDRFIAEQAAAGLRRFVDHLLSAEGPAGPADPDDPEARRQQAALNEGRQQLLQAIRSALASYLTHPWPVLLKCAVRLADHLADTLRSLLNEPGNRVGMMLQEVANRPQTLDSAAVPFIYLGLSVPETRARFAGRVGLLRDRAVVTELIAQVHRADDPEVAKGLAAVRQMAFFEQPGWWERLSDELAGPTARWVASIGVEAARKGNWLRGLAREGSPAQRAAAVEQLCRWQAEESTAVLRELADGADAPLAQQAADELARRPGTSAAPDERTRDRLAREHLARMAFQRFWSRFDLLPEEVRRFAASRLGRVVPDLAERLAAKLSDADRAERLRAVQVVVLCPGLPQAGPIRDPLLACCSDGDAHVRASAVKALGQVAGEESESLIRAALADSDRRVRANAIEALQTLRREAAGMELARMLDDPDNRVRANAVKALMAMDVASARHSLERMLSAQSPAHRLSALWVVEQVGWLGPAKRVLHLARTDGDRRVRRRALAALGELRRVYRSARRPGAPKPAEHASAGAREGVS